MAKADELAERLTRLENEVQRLRQALAEVAAATLLSPAQVAIVRKALGRR